jgi:hypothetical protein
VHSGVGTGIDLVQTAPRYMPIASITRASLTMKTAVATAVTFVTGIESGTCCGPIISQSGQSRCSIGYSLMVKFGSLEIISAYHRASVRPFNLPGHNGHERRTPAV